MSTKEKWEWISPAGNPVTLEWEDGYVDISPEAIASLYAARVQEGSREGEVGVLTLDSDIFKDWLEELGYE